MQNEKEFEVLMNLLNLKRSDIMKLSATNNVGKHKIYIQLVPRDCSCPHCQSNHKKIKDYSNVTIRHALVLDANHEIILRKRRYVCFDCGKTFSEPNPFTSDGSSISIRTEIAIMRDLKDPSVTYSRLAKKYNMSTTQVMHIFDKYIHYARNTLPKNLCIDEVYISPSSDYKYACIIYDYDSRKVVDIIKGRRKGDLMAYFSNIPQCERDKVLHSTADMWDTYREISNKYLVNCVHSVDSFHVVKAINEKLNSKRCQVMNRYKGIINNSNASISERKEAQKYYYLYKNFYRLLLSNYSSLKKYEKRFNKVFQRYLDTDDLIDLMLNTNQALRTLYTLKETYIRFNSDPKVIQSNAAEKLDNIINQFCLAAVEVDGLACCAEIANMLTNWRLEIISSFPVNEGEQRYHNGIAESCNAIIKKMIIASNGITNFERFRNRVLYIMDSSDSFVHRDYTITKQPNITVIQHNKKKKSEGEQ